MYYKIPFATLARAKIQNKVKPRSFYSVAATKTFAAWATITKFDVLDYIETIKLLTFPDST